jgi:hypothetical protein
VSWDEPDAQEQRMMDGSRGCPWPEELHRWHSERRWHEAKHRYRQQNPALATQEFDDLVGEEARARRAERRAASGGSMEP